MFADAPIVEGYPTYVEERSQMTVGIQMSDHNRPARLSADLLTSWRAISSSAASDAMGGQNVLDPSVKPIWRGARLCGPALTVWTPPGVHPMLMKAIEMAQAGDVLVVNASEDPRFSMIGVNAALWAVRKGVGGAVVAGAVRDTSGIAETGFPVFAMDVSPRATYKLAGGGIGEPVSVGGVVVRTGDLVLGDADGVAIVPREEVAEVLKRALAKQQKDVEICRRIQAGESLYAMMGYNKLFG